MPIGHGVQDGKVAPPSENEPDSQSPITMELLSQYFPAGQVGIPPHEEAGLEDGGGHMCPLDTLLDGIESMLVETTILDEFPEVISPIVKAERMIVIEVLAGSIAPDVVMTMEDEPVSLIGAKIAKLTETVPFARALESKKPCG